MNFIKQHKNTDTQVTPDELRDFLDRFEEDLERRLPELWEEFKEMLIQKNIRYGSSAFDGGSYALVGNMIRQSDKMKRYQHLVEHMIEEGEFPESFGESVFDTIQDQAGYALIGMVLCEKLGVRND